LQSAWNQQEMLKRSISIDEGLVKAGLKRISAF